MFLPILHTPACFIAFAFLIFLNAIGSKVAIGAP